MDSDHNNTLEKLASNTQVGTVIDEHVDAETPVDLWRENHGNLYLAATGLILVVGAGILAYQQMRFRPPIFPSSRAIQQSPIDTTGLTNGPGGIPDLPVSPSTPRAEASEGARVLPPTSDSVVVEVVGAGEVVGVVRIAVYGDAIGFNLVEQALIKNAVAVDPRGAAKWTIPRIELSPRFAIAAYHDVNDDSQLNRNVFGVPTERYGFSNDARGKLGPPTFDQAVISLPEAGATIPISIR